MAIRKPATLPEIATEYAGRVIFLPAVGDTHLFFLPTKQDTKLKALKHSMWFPKPTVYGDAHRAAASVEALEWLRDNIGHVKLSQEVWAWYQAEVQVAPIPPIQGLPLFPYQLEAVGFLLGRNRAMLSLSPGLGKTLVSATAASLLHNVKRILVVAPASLLYMWRAELYKWGPKLKQKPHVEIWQRRDAGYDRKPEPGWQLWAITNPENVVSRFKTFAHQQFDLLILDESIYYKNRNSLRTEKMTLLAENIPFVWELTGAPATRLVDDMWAQFHLLKPKAYSSYWRFTDEYCIVDKTVWAKQVAANKLKAEELIKRRFRDIYFARSQEEVLNIPDWIFSDIDIRMTTGQEKAYSEIAYDLWTKLQDEQDQTTIINITNHLAMVVRLIQAASNPLIIGGKNDSGKWSALPELLSLHEPPYIVWTTFIESAKTLHEYLSSTIPKVEYMIGDTKPEERQAIVDRYQAGKIDCVILGQAVGSFGLTLTAARTAVYLERNFDGSYFQSLHRFRRIGTKHSPVVLLLKSVFKDGSKTIDHIVHNALDYRVSMVQKLTVGMITDVLKGHK